MKGHFACAAIALLLLSVIMFVPSARAVSPPVTLDVISKNFGVLHASGGTGFGQPIGPNTMITVFLAAGGGNDATVTGVECGGLPLTKLFDKTQGAGVNVVHTVLYYRVGFPNGILQICSATFAGEPEPGGMVWGWITQSWSNVNQATPIVQSNFAVGTNELLYSVVLPIAPPAEDMMSSFVESCCQLKIPADWAGQAQTAAQLYGGANYMQTSNRQDGAAAIMNYNVPAAGNDNWVEYNIDIKAALSPPNVGTDPATGVVYAGATLHGRLIDLGSAAAVTVGFVFGTDPALLVGTTSVTVASLVAPAFFAYTFVGAQANTVYYFKATASGDGTSEGAILSFTTPSQPSGGGGTTTPPIDQQTNFVYSALPPTIVQCSQVTLVDNRSQAANAILYTWDFGDGSVDQTSAHSVTHGYGATGDYEVRVSVQDAGGAISNYAVLVTVPSSGACQVGAFVVRYAPAFGATTIVLMFALAIMYWRREYNTRLFRLVLGVAVVTASLLILFVVPTDSIKLALLSSTALAGVGVIFTQVTSFGKRYTPWLTYYGLVGVVLVAAFFLG